jgi:hypothetical protein
MESDLWHFDGRTYRLICEPVSYPRFDRRRVDGRMVTVNLPPLEFTVCTAVLVGNDGLAQNPRSDE